ncbi:MAG: hypothetical protein M9924_21590 [Rhizobiaceae bacterium]|nr:hypothetical protein [Rhizobiaceae bacterium]
MTIAIIATMTNMLAGKAGGGHWGGLIGAALILSIVASGFVFVLTFIPAAIFIVWSEARSYRKCGVHVAAGIGMSILAILSLHATNGGSDLASTPDAIAGMLGGGIVAGAVYWAISGKRAGNWRHESA